MEKKTALYNKHLTAGAKMVPFAGYLLPVQYESGIRAEHEAVRTRAGLFDVSHMGELLLTGRDALQNLNFLLTNDFTDLKTGYARYSPMCSEDGGTVDDVIVCKFSDDAYFTVVNAANKDKDFAWMRAHLTGETDLKDVSDDTSQMALQGPDAAAIIAKLAKEDDIPQRYYTFIQNALIGEIPCLISKTGYTGELGYEIYCRNDDAPAVWDMILTAGKAYGITPCGLGARDTLRLEAAMPLYGHELSADITPAEAGLSMFIKPDKPDFIGKQALIKPRSRKRIGLRLTERGIAREGTKVLHSNEEIGFVTSGTMSPTLGEAIAMALVPADFEGHELTVEVRGKAISAQVVDLPFYKRSK